MGAVPPRPADTLEPAVAGPDAGAVESEPAPAVGGARRCCRRPPAGTHHRARVSMVPRPRRILYVHPCAGMGGAPMSLLYLIEHLDRSRYAPEVLFLGTPGEEVQQYARRGIPYRVRDDITSYPHAYNARVALRSMRPWEVVTRPFQILPSARHMGEELMARPADLVHINTSVLLPVGLGAARAGVPVVWHVRETLYPGWLGIRLRAVRGIIDRCSSAVI